MVAQDLWTWRWKGASYMERNLWIGTESFNFKNGNENGKLNLFVLGESNKILKNCDEI